MFQNGATAGPRQLVSLTQQPVHQPYTLSLRQWEISQYILTISALDLGFLNYSYPSAS